MMRQVISVGSRGAQRGQATCPAPWPAPAPPLARPWPPLVPTGTSPAPQCSAAQRSTHLVPFLPRSIPYPRSADLCPLGWTILRAHWTLPSLFPLYSTIFSLCSLSILSLFSLYSLYIPSLFPLYSLCASFILISFDDDKQLKAKVATTACDVSRG